MARPRIQGRSCREGKPGTTNGGHGKEQDRSALPSRAEVPLENRALEVDGHCAVHPAAPGSQTPACLPPLTVVVAKPGMRVSPGNSFPTQEREHLGRIADKVSGSTKGQTRSFRQSGANSKHVHNSEGTSYLRSETTSQFV